MFTLLVETIDGSISALTLGRGLIYGQTRAQETRILNVARYIRWLHVTDRTRELYASLTIDL